MAGALTAIESALHAVARQARALTRGKTRQIKTADEIDALKSLAYSWFETFRGELLGTFEEPELSLVDGEFREVLNATGRYSVRSTYVDHLKAAKAALVDLRAQAATRRAGPPPVAAPVGSEAPPLFAALAPDPRMQDILGRRWQEVEKCIAAGAALAATVMMGGLLESLFLARINRAADKRPIFTAKGAPKDKKTGTTSPLSEWTLMHYIEVCHELRWISKSAKDVGGVLREFRNYIHPHKEFTDGVVLSGSDAEMFWSLTKTMTKQILASTAVPPL